MKALLCFVLTLAPAFAQITEIATDANGLTLLTNTRFRLQTESDVTNEQKIYRWQNGVWTRLRVRIPDNFGIIQGSLNTPFVAGDGSVYGWSLFPTHGLFPVVPPRANVEVVGVQLPDGFPHDYIRVSGNGRYVVGATGGPVILPQEVEVRKLLDTQTGEVTTLPSSITLPVVSSNGTVAYLTDANIAVTALDGTARQFPKPPVVYGFAISSDARWLAVDWAQDTSRVGQSLRVISLVDGSSVEVTPITVTNAGRPIWSLGNTGAAFLSAGSDGRLTRLNLWDPVTRQSRVVTDSTEPFAEIAASANGNAVWVATETNRLSRHDLAGNTRQEILPPLGHADNGAVTQAIGIAVPGSAMQLPGKYTRDQRVSVNGDPWPLSDVNTDGYWFQIPWEWRGSSKADTLLVRAGGNPFEDMAAVAYQSDYFPYFPLQRNQYDQIYGPLMIVAHSDFHGIVTKTDPARGGENVHVYMTGLGALVRAVPTGVPGPLDAVPVVRPLVCSGTFPGTANRTDHLPVPAVVYAGGMIGIYQLEVTLPANVPDGVFGLACWDGVRETNGILYSKP